MELELVPVDSKIKTRKTLAIQHVLTDSSYRIILPNGKPIAFEYNIENVKEKATILAIFLDMDVSEQIICI